MDKETYSNLNIPANCNFGMDDIVKNLDHVDVLSDDDENCVFFSDNDITDNDMRKLFEEDPLSSTLLTSSELNTPTSIGDKEIQDYLNKNVAKSTSYKDNCAESRFQTFLTSINPNDKRKIHEIPQVESNDILCKFFYDL